MTRTDVIFIASGVLQTIRSWSASKSGSFQSLVFWGSFVVIALLAFGWAVIFRNHDRPHRHHRHRRSHEPAMNSTNEDDKGGGFFTRLTHKHRKRKRRLRANPTLAETGGLPEARDREKRPPAPSA
jgi:hypothetical protein